MLTRPCPGPILCGSRLLRPVPTEPEQQHARRTRIGRKQPWPSARPRRRPPRRRPPRRPPSGARPGRRDRSS
ncbi:MAG TPA: hypothetical protein ENJ09_06415 [Planctomycetes bacterium]|nr:hypothetical protein [Planctomycetota bacterium]